MTRDRFSNRRAARARARPTVRLGFAPLDKKEAPKRFVVSPKILCTFAQGGRVDAMPELVQSNFADQLRTRVGGRVDVAIEAGDAEGRPLGATTMITPTPSSRPASKILFARLRTTAKN